MVHVLAQLAHLTLTVEGTLYKVLNMQATAPTELDVNCDTAHAMQLVCPVPLWYVPTEQLEQIDEAAPAA